MKRFALILGMAAAVMPASAEWTKDIDFESGEGYKALSIYDCWEKSPFRTGELSLTPLVVANPDVQENEIIQTIPNASAKVAGAQRSRFGSNRFGLRVDLADENFFELTPSVKYVHVKLHKPVEGRVMLVGLGSRNDVPDQDPYVEQFWAVSRNAAQTNVWNDMVFEIKGAGGITMRSFVLVPDLESPHNMTSDFLFYIDDIKVNSNSSSELIYDYYGTSFNKAEEKLGRDDRYSQYVEIKGSKYGDQRVAVTQQTDKFVYQDLLQSYPLVVEAGETITAKIGYKGTWMNTYCYLDLDRNGHFDVNDDATGEILSYSHFNGKNSTGNDVGQGNTMDMPAFKVPDNLEPGLYRMRFKVDWNCVKPEGNTADGNTITANGGMIADIMLNVVAPGAVATVNDFQLNGEILAADGTKLSNYQVPAFEPFEVLIAPENGFENNGFTIKYGYGTIDTEGEENRYDRYGNPNWFMENVPFGAFDKGSDLFTIPAKYMFGNVLLQGRMAQVGTRDEYYSVNFDKNQTISRTDRHLNALTIQPQGGDAKQISLADNTNPRYVYVEKLENPIDVYVGKPVSATVDYTGRAMHSYLYVDYDDNGFFDYTLSGEGVPANGSEIVSFTHYQGKNSAGTTTESGNFISKMPDFTIPANLAPGKYRARLKVDWDNVNPGAREPNDESNKIWDNGGGILDFMLNVIDKNDDESSIDEIGAADADNEVFDLLGRKVAHPAKGSVLIVNGKATKL